MPWSRPHGPSRVTGRADAGNAPEAPRARTNLRLPQSEHRSLSTTADELQADESEWILATASHGCAELERRSVVRMVLEALNCFAGVGDLERRRADLLRRYKLEEASYAELAAELGVNEGALRVRVHEAIRAFREYLRDHLRDRDPEIFRQIPAR